MSNSDYNQLPSSSSSTSDLPEQPTCEYIDDIRLDWSGRGTSHVYYDKSEVLPLTQGEFLGYGMNGGVYETTCNGIRLAWKRRFCRRKIGERERSEIEIIKKLSHRHIVRLVGTYTHGSFLGLLLWPVATCDLATLLEDVDWLQKKVLVDRGNAPELAEKQSKHDTDREARLRALGVLTRDEETDSYPAKCFLKQTIGCIASAIAYLHASNIKHKDLKPSNILLSRDGLWLTDFGTATDFSVLTSSVTDEGERGTPKYFAPEVASFAPSGRSADIFSMGCILFEIMTLHMSLTLELSQGLRRLYDRSFQSNLDTIVGWFEEDIFSVDLMAADDYLMGLVRWMMEEEAAMRPTADVVEQEVLLINGLDFALCAKRARQEQHWGFYRPCCSPGECPDRTMSFPPNPKPMITIYVECGSSYFPSNSRTQSTVFLKHSGGGIVESVHMFTVSALGDDFMWEVC